MRAPSPQGLLLLTLLALAGCRSGAAAASNLDALMDSDDRLRHVAPVQSAWRYNVRQLFPQGVFRDGSFLSQETEPVAVGDPSYRALKELIQLRDAGGFRNDHARRIAQVRHYARYGTSCRGRLAREFAQTQLGEHAAWLELDEPVRLPETAANPPELSEALRSLVETAVPVMAGDEGATARTDLAAACEVVAGLEMDVDGLWRALHALGTLASREDFEQELYAPLLDLSLELQRRACAQGLAYGVLDPDPLVRAAAYRANHRVFGDAFLLEATFSLLPPPGDAGPDPRSVVFGLRPPLPDEDEVFLAVFGLLREHGLPLEPELPEHVRIQRRILLFDVLVQVAQQFQLYEDRPRTAAMLALSALVGEDPVQLRFEHWVRWWGSVRPSEVASYDALVAGLPESERPR